MSHILTFFGGAICGALIMALVAAGGDDDDR
jgi:hypothetical protein